MIFVCRSQFEVCSQTCCILLLMSSREGCLWSLLTATYLCNVISCCSEPSACCFVLCDVMKAAGKPSLLESHAKYFGCWSGIINCWVMASSWNHDMLHIMIVCIIIFHYLCILFYPVHQNENEIIKNISMIYSIGKLTQGVN